MRRLFLAFSLLSASIQATAAASLAVAPVTLEVVTRGEAASSVVVRNAGDYPINVQTRMMHWTQVDGKDQLDPTDDVFASPPITQVMPGVAQVIRVIRVSKRPVIGEEPYRLLIDELPGPPRGPASNVSLIVRQSLPIFFRSPDAQAAPLGFKLDHRGRSTILVSMNRGDVHQKVIALAVRNARGAAIYSRTGLVGYVLGHSSFAWALPAAHVGIAHIQGRTE